MGIGIYKRPRDGAVFAIVAPKTGGATDYLWQYRIDADRTGRLTATLVRRFGQFSRVGGEPGDPEKSKRSSSTTAPATCTTATSVSGFESTTPIPITRRRRASSRLRPRRLPRSIAKAWRSTGPGSVPGSSSRAIRFPAARVCACSAAKAAPRIRTITPKSGPSLPPPTAPTGST